MSTLLDRAALVTSIEKTWREHLALADMPAKELERIEDQILSFAGQAAHQASDAQAGSLELLTDVVDEIVERLRADHE